MKKIVLIGSGGAGKSTLARQLSEKLNIEVFHLDALHWKPNWEMTSREEQEETQHSLVEKDEWIIDGHYGGTLPIRLQACDTIIYLDMPRSVCVYRAIKRYRMYRHKTRPDMHEGCEEKLDPAFLKWIWDFQKKKRPAILEMIDRYSEGRQVFILKSKREVEAFMAK
ncbi:DNA topology modulation protein [Alkalihalobacillus sp. LMS6]|uniref:DNA topology modulation protein n=1 Tax=Alkalihalobacillus sp. LMS6 TaxID=2924034 RepID=UPI0020D1D6F3|nr:DNA topology modulation protein [Alkalihalobacillus sp. LMS6]UTR05963.1 DNA topology modulation protein [Alkalihalobacillus sp. LMS6]